MAIVGIVATYFAVQQKISAMALALVLSMTLNFLGCKTVLGAGCIEMASKLVLRTSAALLALRATVAEVIGLGLSTAHNYTGPK